MKNGKFLAGIITGLGAGTLLGLLFAPDKGSKTRKKLMSSCASGVEKENLTLHDVIRNNKQKLQQEADNITASLS